MPADVAAENGFGRQVILLIDGNIFRTQLAYRYQTIVNGDCKSASIACASIVAKVYRDRILEAYDKIFPQYGFARHKGYPTPEHYVALKKHGACAIHRKTFGGVL
jgi:ribonuclease HII